MSLFRRSDNEMAESELLEYEIKNSYAELQMKELRYEQAVEEQRRKDRAEYKAEQEMYAERAQDGKRAQHNRKIAVKRNGGRWIQQPDGTVWDSDGNIIQPSDLC